MPGKGPYADRWLLNPFKQRGFDCRGNEAHLETGKKTMAYLIDQLNLRLEALETAYPGRVDYINLRTIIANGGSAEIDWADDLHPNRAAFKLMAMKIQAAINNSPAPPTPA